MLKEMTHPKSPTCMCIGSDFSNIFPEAMGRPETPLLIGLGPQTYWIEVDY
jgi:hypothetical protein